jgi:hypothetical protein
VESVVYNKTVAMAHEGENTLTGNIKGFGIGIAPDAREYENRRKKKNG